MKEENLLQDLKVERMQVEAEIKKIQKAYYIDKRISENEYNLQFQNFNERLAEIEGEKTTLELLGEKKIKRGKINLLPQIKREEKKEKRFEKIKGFFLAIIGFFRHPFISLKRKESKKRFLYKLKNYAENKK